MKKINIKYKSANFIERYSLWLFFKTNQIRVAIEKDLQQNNKSKLVKKYTDLKKGKKNYSLPSDFPLKVNIGGTSVDYELVLKLKKTPKDRGDLIIEYPQGQ